MTERVEGLKAAVCQAIEAHRAELIALAQDIFQHPELGYKETRTAQLVGDQFSRLGLPYRDRLALTGVKAALAGGTIGPTVAVLGELDALAVREHPTADPRTGAAHACGHNAQIAAMLGVATGLVHSGVLPHLSGRVVCFAVPAEEYVEVEYRLRLVREGKIEFLGGKPELVRLGEFDDVDLAMMVHVTSRRDDGVVGVSSSSNGCVVKQVQFLGKAAHAGGAPDRGVNALNAALLALQAIHANRETFRDADTVRVHPIITKGGDVVNVVPADVRMETYVRGRTLEAIQDANRKVDRALKAGALAVGARVRIETLPGYLPLENDATLAGLFKANAAALVGDEQVRSIGYRTGSTDMGDVSQIMPAIHPYCGGGVGTGHGADYRIEDYETACILPAKLMAMTVIDLLANEAAAARALLRGSQPKMSKEAYLTFQRGLARTVEYNGAEE